MNPEEVEEQISEMFKQVPINLLRDINGFILILHGDKGCAINMSKALLNLTQEEKIIIVTSLLRKLVDDPSELLSKLLHR